MTKVGFKFQIREVLNIVCMGCFNKKLIGKKFYSGVRY
jgi:hypothetical protein